MTDTLSPTWSVYLIRTVSNSLYTGVTTDVARRFVEHQNGRSGAKYLRGKGPLTLVYHAPCQSKRRAFQWEFFIKRWPKSTKEALVSSQLPLAVFASQFGLSMKFS
ncbi:GIY-YIG nuclease family protein [Celerinatantimonas sp. MCCC 1A17872]|uniref:GIY-YIG nuclease family protein n=1 Tax=Celerinatantimonas sp. MCCC 1A17872 TaxID=3177514 RepID=UPI0038C22390